MKDLPYYRLWVKDFDTNEDVRLLNLPEAGLYLFALNHAWVNDGLPESPEDIARVLRVTAKDFARHWPRVSRCFYSDGHGRLRNKRQEEERAEAKKISEHGGRAARTRWGRNAHAMPTQCIGIDSAMHKQYDRASDSDSDSGNKEKPSLREISDPIKEPPILIAGRTLEDWKERWYYRHPKQKSPHLVEHSIQQIHSTWQVRSLHAKVSTEAELFCFIDSSHLDACNSEDWKKQRGKYAPKLHEYLDEETYLHGPKSGDDDDGEEYVQRYTDIMQ